MKDQNPIIEKLTAHIEAECTAIDREARFDEMLDECYSFDSVGGPFASMCPSRVLKEVDPIAYRCGVNDYADGERWVEIGNDNYDQDEVYKACEVFIDELNDQLSKLESELEEEEAEEDPNPQEVGRINRAIADLKADIEACERHAF